MQFGRDKERQDKGEERQETKMHEGRDKERQRQGHRQVRNKTRYAGGQERHEMQLGRDKETQDKDKDK